MKSSRQAALDILLQVYERGAYSNLALNAALERGDVPRQEQPFLTMLVYGVLEQTVLLEYQLEQYLTRPFRKLTPRLAVILRMGAYQILFAEKIPAAVAINESVNLAKKNGCAFAAGMVNAVLRKVAAHGIVLPPYDDAVAYCNVKTGFPVWLLERWRRDYGEETMRLLAEGSHDGACDVRVNTLKTTAQALQKALEAEGVSFRPLLQLPDALRFTEPVNHRASPAFAEGEYHVQGAASQLCCQALDVRPGDTVLDLCAAPGGKPFTLAQQMKNRGSILACDVHGNRLPLIEKGAERLGITIVKTMRNDATAPNEALGQYDRILCDVPCSGFGLTDKKHEIRFKTAQEVDKLPEIQYSIMKTAASCLKPDGVLVYSTCTIHRAENEDVVLRFLEEHPAFEPVTVLPHLPRVNGAQTPYLTLAPYLHKTDGFFISAVRRRTTA